MHVIKTSDHECSICLNDLVLDTVEESQINDYLKGMGSPRFKLSDGDIAERTPETLSVITEVEDSGEAFTLPDQILDLADVVFTKTPDDIPEDIYNTLVKKGLENEEGLQWKPRDKKLLKSFQFMCELQEAGKLGIMTSDEWKRQCLEGEHIWMDHRIYYNTDSVRVNVQKSSRFDKMSTEELAKTVERFLKSKVPAKAG